MSKAAVKVPMDYCSDGEMKLLGREDKRKFVFCHFLKCQGLGDDTIVDKVTENTKIVLKADSEAGLNYQREDPADNPRKPASA